MKLNTEGVGDGSFEWPREEILSDLKTCLDWIEDGEVDGKEGFDLIVSPLRAKYDFASKPAGFTHDTPKKAGFYWYLQIWKNRVYPNTVPIVVEVKPTLDSRLRRQNPPQFEYQRIGGHATRGCETAEGWWFGPIEPPNYPSDYPFTKEERR